MKYTHRRTIICAGDGGVFLVCTRCGVAKPMSPASFKPSPKTQKRPDALRTICRTCFNVEVRSTPFMRARAKRNKWRPIDRVKWMQRALQAPGGPWQTTRADYQARIMLYGCRCGYCGAPGTELDHARSLADGGGNWAANIVPACKSCNSRKSGKSCGKLWPRPSPPGPRSKLP